MEPHSPKLTLDLRPPPWVATHKSSDYIARLEDELRKIQAFNRELPLSVLLLTHAIERLKEQGACDGKEATTSQNDKNGDKKTWMSSAQLWSSDPTLSLQLNLSKPRDGDSEETCKKVGGFSSLKDCPELSPAPAPAREEVGNIKLIRQGLFPVRCQLGALNNKNESQSGRPFLGDELKLLYQASPIQFPALQGPRKQRRCWSPDLHRRFIQALERLGGPQVATPKQIRDLMQIDGLTNDEVKSHLQKYRLHIKKHPRAMTGSSRVKLILAQDSELQGSGHSSSGGAATFRAESTQSGSPHLATGSAKRKSPATSKCDSMEDDYEEKSDSHSWEGD